MRVVGVTEHVTHRCVLSPSREEENETRHTTLMFAIIITRSSLRHCRQYHGRRYGFVGCFTVWFIESLETETTEHCRYIMLALHVSAIQYAAMMSRRLVSEWAVMFTFALRRRGVLRYESAVAIIGGVTYYRRLPMKITIIPYDIIPYGHAGRIHTSYAILWRINVVVNIVH